jgi:putative glutamine amidotransferase
MKPVIGLTCSLGAKKEEWVGRTGLTWDFTKREYHRRVEEHGGIPVLLPAVRDEETVAGLCAIVDGILLTGGEDIEPSYYGEENAHGRSLCHPERDRFETTLLRCAQGYGLPVLGICRGMQVLNVHFGGSLYQDLSERPGTGEHLSPEEGVYLPHEVRIAPGSRLAALLGSEPRTVNSRHHQIVKHLAPGFAAAAFAADGVIEAIERAEGDSFLMGVQWHPELMPGDSATAALFSGFVAAAAARARNRVK